MGIPDEDIYPTATGEALKTVQAHQSPQDVVFYAGVLKSFSIGSHITREQVGFVRLYSAHGSH